VELIHIHRRTPFFQLCTALPVFSSALLRRLRCAIRGFCEGGFSRARDRDLPARHVGATEGRSGFRPRGFRESCAAGTKESRGTQLSGLGLLAQGEIDSAIVHFRSAVKLSPDFALAHMNFSSALVRKGDVLAALRRPRKQCG